jgi:hypothetical protein
MDMGGDGQIRSMALAAVWDAGRRSGAARQGTAREGVGATFALADTLPTGASPCTCGG